MNFTIPKTTPPGKYLVRAEHFQMTYNYNSTKQYIGCAQVEVMGPGGGTPGPFTRFPGAYALTDPGKLPDYKVSHTYSLPRKFANKQGSLGFK